MRREALRRRVWFRGLGSTERALLYLVPRCVETAKNATLVDALAKIIVKIRNALKSPITDLVSQVGRPLAMRLSCIAQKWGHEVASEWALDGKFWRARSTAFKADIGNPLEQLIKGIEALNRQLQELRTLESEARKARVEALKARTKKLKRDVGKLKENESNEQIRPEQVEPHPLDYLTDITRAYSGRTLSTASLEQLAKAQHIADYTSENNDLMMNPKKMAALRNILLQ